MHPITCCSPPQGASRVKIVILIIQKIERCTPYHATPGMSSKDILLIILLHDPSRAKEVKIPNIQPPNRTIHQHDKMLAGWVPVHQCVLRNKLTGPKKATSLIKSPAHEAHLFRMLSRSLCRTCTYNPDPGLPPPLFTSIIAGRRGLFPDHRRNDRVRRLIALARQCRL